MLILLQVKKAMTEHIKGVTVVTVMGPILRASILDAIRSADVAAGESGGIAVLVLIR